MAEAEGFEPSREREPPTRFPGVCLRPLGQASARQSTAGADLRGSPEEAMVEAEGRRSSVLCDSGLTRAASAATSTSLGSCPLELRSASIRSSSVNSAAVIPIRRRMSASVPAASSRCSGTATVA